MCVSVFCILPSRAFRRPRGISGYSGKCSEIKKPFSLKLLSSRVRSIINSYTMTKSAIFFTCNVAIFCNTYVTVMCDHVTWSTRYCGFSVELRRLWRSFTRASERYAHRQCNTVVHVKRSVCDCGHAFTLKKRKASVLQLGRLRTQWNVEKPYCLRKSY